MKILQVVLAISCLWAASTRADEPVDADLLLRSGTVYRGDDVSRGEIGDVAVQGGKIVAVGQFKLGQIGRTIDCRGLCIAPGFIDLHTHSDDQVISPTLRACVNYVIQGCTTSVTGNCGSGPTNVADFYTKIDAAGAGTNVAHLLPQGSLRERVIGNTNRKATADDIAKMKELTDKAMSDGAWGMSTGLIYVPSVYADLDELTAIASVVAAKGGIYASHIRGEGRDLLTAVNEAMRIGEVAKLPVHISHFKSSGSENWGLIRQAAAAIETAREQGRIVTADQYPYTASSTSLEATLFPTWARSGGNDELVKRLDDAEAGPRIKQEVQRDIT
ncbi:MAG TPA: amidohydrolase family protein, partial [Schlesneria sp.]